MSVRKGSVNFHLFKDQNKGLIKITVNLKGFYLPLLKSVLSFKLQVENHFAVYF